MATLPIEIAKVFGADSAEEATGVYARILEENEALRKALADQAAAAPRKEHREYSEFKSNGVRKAVKTDSIRSYDDFIAVRDYFSTRGRDRDRMMWVLGICTGLRACDLIALPVRSVLNPDGSFMKRIRLYERKTSKAQNCLITEAMVYEISRYLGTVGEFDYRTAPLFPSKKTGEPITTVQAWRVLREAQEALRLPIHVGSHTMRRSFADIVACVDDTDIDMNTIAKIQGLLNHSNPSNTMRYLGVFEAMYDRARVAVSDFCMGKTEVKELVLTGTSSKLGKLIDAVERLEQKTQEGQGKNEKD